MNRGVQHFYYTRQIPSKSVAIAKVSTSASTASELTDVDNQTYLPGTLDIRAITTLDTAPADFTAPEFGPSVQIFGAVAYKVDNQFLELTTFVGTDNSPLYYVHSLPDFVDGATIVDLNEAPVVSTKTLVQGTSLFHDMDGAAYRVRYVDQNGVIHTDLLMYTPVLMRTQGSASGTTYGISGRVLNVATSAPYYLRFTDQSGYRVLPPYNALPNTPWYPRIRYALDPVAPEWARQIFVPNLPYLLGTWVPGTVLAPDVVELERKKALVSPTHVPDLLVFDKNYQFKLALEGTAPGAPRRRGTLYNWRRGMIRAFDGYKARIQLGVELDPTDIVYAFYCYEERDILYTDIDCNPYTNPQVKNRVVQFYFKSDGVDPFRYVYYRILDPATGPIAGLTNDTAPATGTLAIFANLVVGASIAVRQFDIEDARIRGGGLASAYQKAPQAVNFWDLGYWDGKPYPIGGTVVIYVPQAALTKMTAADIQHRVEKILPLGTLAAVRYYSADGTETV